MSEIKKIIAICNVGKFRLCKPKGDVEFRKINLIYAGNARGKTTLCEVLRSLQSGDVGYVDGRRTLGGVDRPFVELRLDGRNCRLEAGRWTETLPEIAVFDDSFVNDNVYAGQFVHHDNKRNMYGVVVGSVGVKLQRRVDELDAASRETARKVRDAKAAVERFLPAGITLDEFISLRPIDGIEDRLGKKRSDLAALERADEISKKPKLELISIPALPDNFAQTLDSTIETVSADAEQHVHDHLAKHTVGATEEWLSRGVGYQKGTSCPFCGQSIQNSDLISAYSAFFGDAYRELRLDVEGLETKVSMLDSKTARPALSLVKEQNEGRSKFWRELVEFEPPTVDLDEAFIVLEQIREAASHLVGKKKGAVLERVTVDEVFNNAKESFLVLQEKVEVYNAECAAINRLIDAKKVSVQTQNPSDVRSEIARLLAVKKRSEPAVEATCAEYSRVLSDKERIEAEKERIKAELDSHAGSIFPKFERRINILLFHFGADFKIQEVQGSYSGGRASSYYQLVINHVPVELGDSSTPISTPSFRNTLSAGDRTALAFSFFVAQMELDPNLAEKIIVFDDPFTSQDSSRRTCTQQRICRLAASVKQVLVLSHEPSFLRLIYDCVNGNDVKTLQLAKVGKSDTLVEKWDIVDATRTDYHKDLIVLQRYAHEASGEPREVAGTIRLALEGHLRSVFPDAFPGGEWLGDFIVRIRAAGDDDRLSGMKPALEELEDINDYSKKYHHRGNGDGVNRAQIDEGELVTWVKRALGLLGAAM